MHKQNAQKLADVFEPIRPSAALLAQTEALMRSAPQPTPIRRKPTVLRFVAAAACLVLICSAAFAFFAAPSDLTATPGDGLVAVSLGSDTLRIAAPPLADQSLLTTAELTAKSRNTHGANAAAMQAQAICTDVTVYAPEAENAGFVAVIFADFKLREISYLHAAPEAIEQGDKITAVIFCYEEAEKEDALAQLDTTGETTCVLGLSTAADGNLYTEDGATVLAYSAWMLHEIALAPTEH
ncbi:MAG: hypothetical protein IKU55_03585 [Clostridia bacterium]|nr:hypothetical protein [Clostridia bacterium]